jgi:hypothetical protein
MPGNDWGIGVPLDLTNLAVTGDASPQAGTATEVTVSFSFVQPFYSIFLRPTSWPFTVKVYAEGLGDWAREDIARVNGTCNQPGPDYEIVVPVTLDREGVYLVSALVELDDGAGIVMGYSDQQTQISVWTPQ